MFSQQHFTFFNKPTLLAVVLLLAIMVFSALNSIAASSSTDAVIQNSGSIILVGVDAYGGDITSNHDALSVNLGEIQLGSSKSVSFYLRSASNVPTTLAFHVNGWEPKGLESFMRVSWSYNGKQLTPNEEIPIKIDINPAWSADFVDYLIANRVISFSFSLNISATES